MELRDRLNQVSIPGRTTNGRPGAPSSVASEVKEKNKKLERGFWETEWRDAHPEAM